LRNRVRAPANPKSYAKSGRAKCVADKLADYIAGASAKGHSHPNL